MAERLVYVGGGYESGVLRGFFTINCYDPDNNSWSSRSPINATYCHFAMTIYSMINYSLLA